MSLNGKKFDNELDAYKNLINSHAIVAVTDRKGLIIEVNAKFCEISGYTRDELIGKNHKILNSSYHDSKFFKDLWKTIASGKIWQGEIRNRKKNGSHYWVNTSIIPILDQRGKIGKYLAIRYDITEEKFKSHNLEKINRIQKLFIKSEFENPKEAFEVLLSELLDITESEYGYIGKVLKKEGAPYLKTYAITDISWNDETRKFYAEKAVEGLEFHNLNSLFGYVLKNGEFVISNDPANDYRKGGLPAGHPPLRAYLGIPIFYRNELIGSIGIANRAIGYDQELIESIRPFLETCSLMIETLNNQEQQKFLQRQIELSEKIFKATVESSYDGYWDWHIKDDYEYMSSKFWQMFGVESSSKKPHPSEWQSIIHEDDLKNMLANLQKHFETKGIAPFDQTVRYKHVNGNTVWVICRGQVIEWDDNNNPVRMVGTHTDITSLKEKEEYIKKKNEELKIATKKAYEASNAKSDFLANMSHEIRTPMNGVIGFTELLKLSSLNREQMNYVESIEKSGKSLIELINDILDYSKIESGSLELNTESTKIDTLIDDVIQIFTPNITNKKIAITKNLFNGIPLYIEVDAFRLKQIIINLVGNAFKFTEKGEITISAEYYSDQEELQISVKDTGIGIDQRKLETIFNAFQQADLTTTKKYGGTGLGLAICRKLVTLMGGEIHCDSQIGRGTIFSFNIHAKKSSQKTEKIIRPKFVKIAQYDLSVLIVEDNQINQELCEKFLNKLGVQPEIASNGKEALNILKKKSFDLIFMDIRMPKMDGYAVTKAIREMKNIKQPVIYALTANAFEEDKELARSAGMQGFLPKPIRIKNFEQVLSQFNKKAS